MSVADYVAPGRCSCCGSKPLSWTPDKCVETARAWFLAHGASPSSFDWRNGTPEHPARSTVEYIFGTWSNMLRAAELPVARKEGYDPVWTKDRIAEAILDHVLSTGSWPTYRQWAKASGEGRSPSGRTRPGAHTVSRVFGTFNAAKLYAGWDGTSKRTRAATPEFRCSGCGGDEYSETIGCKSCWDRLRHRARRAAAKSGAAEVVELLPGSSGSGADGGSHRSGRPTDLETETAAQAA